jgi:hypothetical protein
VVTLCHPAGFSGIPVLAAAGNDPRRMYALSYMAPRLQLLWEVLAHCLVPLENHQTAHP